MKTYADREQVVATRTECVLMVCDMCNKRAEHPNDLNNEFESKEYPYVVGSGFAVFNYNIDEGTSTGSESLDLCYDCARNLIKAIRSKKIRAEDLEDLKVAE